MDILKSIKEQVQEIKGLSTEYSLEQIITHIERAELYYLEGLDNVDENYFTDVVYRTNQAFEGSLRQSYMILADKSEKQTNNKRTFDIEEYFESNSIFNDRVLKLFKNYRMEWRNKSSHDHKLFFNQSEAFLAVVNVSSYVYVLFNQIIEKLAFVMQEEELKEQKEKKKIISKIFNRRDINLKNKVIELIKEFSVDNEQLKSQAKEIELIGMFNAFIKSASPTTEVFTNYKIETKGNVYRPDIFIQIGDEKLIIEIKRLLKPDMAHENQLLEYLRATNVEDGILWYPVSVPGKNFLKIDDMTYLERETFYITTISTFFDS